MGGGEKLSCTNCSHQLVLSKLVCHFVLWLIPLLFKACHYQQHYILPLIYIDKKVPADQSADTVVSFCQLIPNYSIMKLLRGKSDFSGMRYFLPPKQAHAAQGSLAPYATLHAGTVLLLLCVSQLCSGADEFPVATQSIVWHQMADLWYSRNTCLDRLHVDRHEDSPRFLQQKRCRQKSAQVSSQG